MKNKIDIKKINIPNICFSLISDKDDRSEKFSKQRKQRGFDESETWALDLTIAKFIYPRLKEYISISKNTVKRSKRHKQDLDLILKAFELIVKCEGTISASEDEVKLIDKGLDKFRKYYFSLWW